MSGPIHVLSFSDQVVELIYSTQIKKRFADVDIAISCGDLPYYYVEYVITNLDVPVFFVHGNHDAVREGGEREQHAYPCGGVNLHNRVVNHKGILLAGVEGSIRYSPGYFQYTQMEMWLNVAQLVPRLVYNRLRHGRALDVFVTHAPAWGIHDQPDWTHQGARAFRWLLEVIQPAYHFHGHVHIYGPNVEIESRFRRTRVINTYQYRKTMMVLEV